ncbi:Enhancing lycopene biosynthesis protein 2 [Abditibacterium utsteinense]|uniref:Enhancing lycopene biosynthesis protein 2 n=1 Tax=Abditibacterium utsteinense TaxID=1960156 RepID=A0A2S8SWA9_9BACT|nr:isoprenoid biosynthesis glyoxalase ElbB [Abditibacterium utsteinense]PQV65082.1 Enhancing lycopene biosynthesis protein 2 [Abditibacterium utsteinense]
MIKVGVILSGCGLLDGSEISEAVLTFLALDRAGASAVALAPDVDASDVIDHYTGNEMRGQGGGQTRNVLAESARIVRGKITSLHEVSAHDIDALIVVGGYGAVKNLCTFARDGVGASINPQVQRLISEVVALGKPLGSMCIASVVVALALRSRENGSAPILTIGDDLQTLTALESWGARHQTTNAEQICIDEGNRIVSTPAFMLATGPAQAEIGINKLVEHILSMAAQTSQELRDNVNL